MQSYQSTTGAPTTSTTTSSVTPIIWFDKDYLNSNEGLMKIVVIVCKKRCFFVVVVDLIGAHNPNNRTKNKFIYIEIHYQQQQQY